MVSLKPPASERGRGCARIYRAMCVLPWRTAEIGLCRRGTDMSASFERADAKLQYDYRVACVTSTQQNGHYCVRVFTAQKAFDWHAITGMCKRFGQNAIRLTSQREWNMSYVEFRFMAFGRSDRSHRRRRV